MKSLLALLTIALLSLGAAACGSSNKHTGLTTDEVGTPKAFDSDDAPVRFYGHEADAADRQAITALLTRYYAVAARGDGAEACPMIDSLIAETIAEDYGELPALRGKTCTTVVSKLFAQHHQQLTVDSATLEVTGVRVEGGRALALVRFAKAPVPDYIAVHREGSVWRIWELFAGQLP